MLFPVKAVKSIYVTQALADAQELLKTEGILSARVRETIETLVQAVTLLSNRVNLNSSNSSVRPAQDPSRVLKQRTQSQGQKRKPGGQEGHKGKTLEQVEYPDEVQELAVDRRTVPVGIYKTVGYESRQVFDMHISLFVTE